MACIGEMLCYLGFILYYDASMCYVVRVMLGFEVYVMYFMRYAICYVFHEVCYVSSNTFQCSILVLCLRCGDVLVMSKQCFHVVIL